MNMRSKIILRFLLTFLIGAVLGAAVNRVLVRQHIRSLFEMRSRGFLNPFQDVILKRTPASSRPAVEALLETHGRYLTEIDARFRDEIEASFKELMKDLSEILPADKMKEIESLLQAPPPPFGKPGGPRRFPGAWPRGFERPPLPPWAGGRSGPPGGQRPDGIDRKNGPMRPPGRPNPLERPTPPERRF
jgi:hypothetical protein